MEEILESELANVKTEKNFELLNKIISSLFESIKEEWTEVAKGETHITSKEDEFNQVKAKFTQELSKSVKNLIETIFIPELEKKTQESKVEEFKETIEPMVKLHLEKIQIMETDQEQRNKSSFNTVNRLFGDLKKHLRSQGNEEMESIDEKTKVKLDENDGTIYKGTLDPETELPHGIGVKSWPNGTSYQGYFSKGEFHKWGILKKKGGEGYIGDWNMGKISGQGKSMYADGSYYEGTHVNDGEKTGKGVFVFENGDKYEGELIDEEFEGWGIYTYADGVVFEGEFKEDDKNGKGKYVFKDGTILSGVFENDLLQGAGKYEYPDGSSFEGDFVNGEKQGSGVFKTKEGLIYEGQWVDNKYQGNGKITYPNGDFYEGTFKSNKFEGEGVYKWKTGVFYKGEFKEGFRQGKGTLNWGVSVYEGEWAYDKPHGIGFIQLSPRMPGKFGLWMRGYQIKSFDEEPDNINIELMFQKFEAEQELGENPFFFNFNGMLEFLVNEEIYKEYKREVNVKEMLDNKIKIAKEKIRQKSSFYSNNRVEFVESKFENELLVENKLKTIFDSSLVEFNQDENSKEKELGAGPLLDNSILESNLPTQSEIINIELGFGEDSQEIFRNEVIFESIRDGNYHKIGKIFEFFLTKKNFELLEEINQIFSFGTETENTKEEVQKFKRISKTVKYLFSLKDNSDRSILHIAAAHGHHIITMHFCAILLNLLKRRLLTSKFIKHLLFSKDHSENNILDLVCIRGFDEYDLDIAELHYSSLKASEDLFLKDIDELLKFDCGENLDVFQKAFDQFENGSKRIVTSDIQVVSTRAFTIYVLLHVSKFLGLEESYIKKERYHLIRNNPLHWAFYHSDPFAVALLVEFNPDIIFWANELRELPPQYIKFTKNPKHHNRAVLILQSILDEISRVLIYKMRIDNIIRANNVVDNSMINSKDLRVWVENTDIVKSSYRILSKAVSKTLTENNRQILEKANEYTSLEGTQGYPFITRDFRFLELLELLSSESRTGSSELKMFRTKYQSKLQNMISWFAYTNGSILAHHSIFIKYKIKPFKVMIGGQSLVHTLCISNSSIALKRVLQAAEYFSNNTEASKKLKTKEKRMDHFRELFNVGTKPELNTPAHLCLIHGSHECFDVLMQYDVDLYIPNARGWTASDLIQSQIPQKFSKVQIFTDNDAGQKLVKFFKSNILFSLKNQSLVSRYMKGDPKIDIQLLRDIVTDTDFYCKDSYTPQELERIKNEFLRLYKDQKEEYNKIKNYFENMKNRDKEKQVTLVKRSQQEIKYEEYYERDIIKAIEDKEINPNKPLKSSLKHLYDMKHILCIVLYSDLKEPENTMIYEQLQKIRYRYQEYDGGIKVEVIRGLSEAWKKGCFYKLLCCLKKNKILKNQFRRYKYFFMVSFSDYLLTKYARDMKFTAYNMKYDYYTNFSDFVKIEELEPLRETQKQQIAMKIINQEFNLDKFKKAGYVSNYFMMHRYKMRQNMIKFWWKNFRLIHYENIFKKTDMSLLTSISLIAFYHGLQHGFYIGFLSLYTNCLFYLATLGVILELIKDFTFLGHNVIPIMSLFVALWSSFFITMWERRQNELAYSFGTHKEQLLVEQRKEFKGRTVLRKINRKLEKETSISASTKRVLTSPLFVIGAGLSFGVYYLVRTLNEMNNRGELVQEKYKFLMNFGIGAINGTLNFMLSQIYNTIVDIGVKFENHKYEQDKINSEIFQKVLYKLFTSCLTITIMVYQSDEPQPDMLQKVYSGISQELLEKQILSNIVTSAVLNYAFNIGKPFYFYFRQRYQLRKLGCFCKLSKIDDFKRKKLKEFKENEAFTQFVLRENYIPNDSSIPSEGGSSTSSLLNKTSNVLKIPIFPGLTKSIKFLQKRKEVMLEYIKYVIGLEKVEESSIMIETQDIEMKLYTSLLTQFAYINFFIPYCMFVGMIAAGINFLVIFLMMIYYGYLSKKSVSRRMKNIGIWITIFRIVSFIGVAYNAFILYKRRGTVFRKILPEGISDFSVVKLIIYSEHVMIAAMFIINYSIEVNPKWVKERIKEEEYAESLQRGFKEEKLNSVLKKSDIDILKNQEEKDIEYVYSKGMRIQKLVLPNGYDDLGLINVND